MPKNTTDPEVKAVLIETVSNEVKDLLEEHWEKIEEYIHESDSRSTNVGFNVNINMKQKNTKVKTRMSYSQINKDSVEDELGDPDQPEFNETTEAAPPARVPAKPKAAAKKKSAKKKSAKPKSSEKTAAEEPSKES